ncbi:hypothetical protein ACFL6Y_07090 [Elusimicrobiota bacterium]
MPTIKTVWIYDISSFQKQSIPFKPSPHSGLPLHILKQLHQIWKLSKDFDMWITDMVREFAQIEADHPIHKIILDLAPQDNKYLCVLAVLDYVYRKISLQGFEIADGRIINCRHMEDEWRKLA